MLNKKIKPETALEKAVTELNNSAIIELIANGSCLERPDILATPEAFDLRYFAVVLLLESSPCLQSADAVRRLEDLSAHPEMIDLVRDLANPLPENSHKQSSDLIRALYSGDDYAVINLIYNEEVTLSDAPMQAFDNMEKFCKFTLETMFEECLDTRLKTRLFLHLRDMAKENTLPKAELHFELMKILLTQDDTPVRNNQLHALWHRHNALPYVRAVELEPEKFSDEFLAVGIMDRDFDFDVRAFKKFPPYYQAMLLNNAGVNIDQFEEEADVEAFDAKAVFELLSADDEYDDRVNWDLVNKTARASDFLKFLSKRHWYAKYADWQMINVQAEPEHWLDFLEKQPGLVNCCLDHTPLYLKDPDRWENILKSSGLQQTNCFAYIEASDNDNVWEPGFKVRVLEDRAEFFEVDSLFDYINFSKLARGSFAEFLDILQNGNCSGRFVNILK